ncbi:MAG: tetratricopeptide repeat protein, partial [Phycisphaerae bacterium]
MHARRLILAGSCLWLAAVVASLGPAPAPAAVQTAPVAPGGAGDASAADASATRQLNAANGLLNRGLHELAAREYRAFLDANPTHARAPVARYGLAVCLYRAGDFAAATAELAQIPSRRDFEFAAEAIVMRGQCLVQLGRPGEAADVLVRLLRDLADHELA